MVGVGCYKVLQARFRLEGLNVENQFGTFTTDIKKPRSLCLPTNKNGEAVLNSRDTLMCYKTRSNPRKSLFPGPLFVNNQFGDFDPDDFRRVTRPTELCVPSSLE